MNDSTTTRTHAELIGDHCPACKSTEAWHGCITEDDSTKFACDECGASMAIIRPKPAAKPKPAKAKRPFSFTFEIDKGRLFIDWRDNPILAFKPKHYLALGGWELISDAESEIREEQATMVGRMVEQRLAEKAAA